MSDTQKERPLSPHLQVYRLPYNALMSIGGRAVGIGLAISLIALCVWFVAITLDKTIFEQTMALIDTPYTKYVLMAWAFATFFYMGNGVRHVLWDLGIGLNESAGRLSGNIVLIVAFLLTFGLWQVSCGCWTGYFTKAAPVAEQGVQ